MIGFVQGRVVAKYGSRLTVASNGLGYDLDVTAALAAQIEESDELTLFVDTVVRENEISHYGFDNHQEKHLFRMLYSLQGIGPKMALSLVSYFGCGGLRQIAENGDVALLKSAPGIGPKSAQSILRELKSEKAVGVLRNVSSTMAPSLAEEWKKIRNAVVGLGYSDSEVQIICQKLEDEDWPLKAGDENSIASSVREVLRQLSKPAMSM